MSNWFKRNGFHLAAIGFFVILCFIYFSPVFKGLVLPQSDVQQAKGMQREIMEFKAKDGTAPLWTNAMFGGMPSYQIWAQYPKNLTTWVIDFFTSVFPNPVHILFLYLVGAYLLFCSLKVNRWLAIGGAVAFGFTSYNIILIEAGHSNQALAIGLFAPVLAGIFMAFRRDYLMGAALTALAMAVEIRSNHIQMTYYLFIAVLVFVIFELVNAVRTKTTADFFKAVGYLAVATLLAVAVNAGNLWTTYEYSKLSQRGESNLKSEKNEKNSGLDREYAYGWSQGVGECITFMVPRAYGGASGMPVADGSHVEKLLTDKGATAEQATGLARQLPMYWGGKPGTSGPYYFGIIIVFLFILGLFVVPGRTKWWILTATVLLLFLSFGRNFPYISDLFFDYFPLYNKFRTVESVLAVAGLLFPILAVLTVNELVSGKQEKKVLQKKLMYAIYITGGILVIVLVIPTLLFSFKSPNDDALANQLVQVVNGDKNFADSIVKALQNDRESLARTDAFRSLVFLLIGAAVVWALIKDKIKPQVAYIVLGVAVLTDLWSLDKNFLNNDNFVEDTQLQARYQPRDVDNLIKRDPSPDFRVLDLTVDTWQDATPTYFHNTVGGYHPAKLKRFYEIIDKQFNGAINEDVLDMLNTKYVITSEQPQQTDPSQPQAPSYRIQNRSSTCGNAWFVPQITWVKGADQEMQAINSFDPRKVAFVDESFKSSVDMTRLRNPGPNDMIRLVDYRPDHLTYEYSAGSDVFTVFAEIWYDKGWNAYVDGKKIDIVRANYILRAAQLPGGNHKLELKFEPRSYYMGENISLVASVILVLALGFAIYRSSRKTNAEAV